MGFRDAKFIDRAVRQEEAHDELVGMRADLRRRMLQAARLFHRIDSTYHYVYESCGNLGAYAESHGFSAREARLLVEVGKALAAMPEVEERVLSGRISIDAAAVLGRFSENAEELARGSEDWLDYAERWTAKKLERELRKRMKEAETGEPVSVMTAVMTSSGRESFERSRVVACRKEGKVLDEGETVHVLAEHYLDSFDDERKKPQKRRMADTSGGSNGARAGGNGNGNGGASRTIPAEVKREVIARQGDICANPKCDNEIFVQFSHGESHAEGGSRETTNLERLCDRCHKLRDAGILVVTRTAEGLEFRTRSPP